LVPRSIRGAGAPLVDVVADGGALNCSKNSGGLVPRLMDGADGGGGGGADALEAYFERNESNSASD